MLDQVPVVEMPKAQAAAELRNYQSMLKERATNADRIAMRALKELAKGRRIVNIDDAFRVTGLDSHNRPKLAIARADWSKVFFEMKWRRGKQGYFCGFNSSERYWDQSVWFERRVFGDGVTRRIQTASVPIIPPQYRPADELSKYHILFEAAWEEVPPVDPFLLKLLKWPFFVILAQWDLTPVERMIFQLNQRSASRRGGRGRCTGDHHTERTRWPYPWPTATTTGKRSARLSSCRRGAALYS